MNATKLSTDNILAGTLIEITEDDALNVRPSKVNLSLVYIDILENDSEDNPAWAFLHGIVLDGPQARALIRALKVACDEVCISVSDL